MLWPDGVGLNEREGTWEVSLQGRNEGLRKQIEVYWWCPLCGLGGLSSGRLWPAPALPVWGGFSGGVTAPHSAQLWRKIEREKMRGKRK